MLLSIIVSNEALSSLVCFARNLSSEIFFCDSWTSSPASGLFGTASLLGVENVSSSSGPSHWFWVEGLSKLAGEGAEKRMRVSYIKDKYD